MDAVYQSGGRFAKPFDHWMLRMVLAIASASLSYHHNDKSHQRAWALVSEALTYAEEVLRPGSISGIQAILLLAQYSFVDPVRFRSWYLIGMAVKVAIDLGLHQDPPAEVLTNPDRLDIRRRVFHSIYCLDRFVCFCSSIAALLIFYHRGLSPAMQRTYSFSDGSVNVALPSITAPGALLEQTHIFLRSPGPALHIVKIRQILSAGYQEMHYSGRDPSPQPLVLIWTLCWRAREWFQQCPKNAPNHFSLLYRLELLYTIIILISPSHRYPILHDYSKALLFDRCMDYISQIHQVLENPSALPFLTYLDIQRVHQVGRIFVNVLSDNYDMLISAAVPAPPPVPAGTPEPPVLGDEDLFNCHARAIRCLSYIRDMLKYCDRKWDIHGHLEQFEDESASIEKTLMDGSVGYMSSQEIYCQDLLSGMPLAGDAYSGYHIGL